MDFKVIGNSVMTDQLREVGRVEFTDTKYESDLRANIEQSAEKLDIFDDMLDIFDDIVSIFTWLDKSMKTKSGELSYQKVTKGRLIEDIERIRELVNDAEKL